MRSIYQAHINAVRSLCVATQTSGIRYGVVLESDAEKFQNWQKRDLIAVMLKERHYSIFNLAPTTDICKDHARATSTLRGQCFLPHRLRSWGAVAVAYDLERVCSHEFFAIHEELHACVPSDIGLYSGAGQYLAADSNVAYFKCESELPADQTHAEDRIHQALYSTNQHNMALLNVFQ